MPTPFPGMDPYLERRGLWEEIHTPLVLEIANVLEPKVQPLYRVVVERRTYPTMLLEPEVLSLSRPAASPDVTPAAGAAGVRLRVCELPLPEEVIEHFLEIRDVITGNCVTTIEILTLNGKLTRDGREAYERQRLKVLGSLSNLVEIDLLRAGDPLPMRVEGDGGRSDYRIVVSRASHRPRADIYLFGVRDAVPDVPIPVQRGAAEPALPLYA